MNNFLSLFKTPPIQKKMETEWLTMVPKDIASSYKFLSFLGICSAFILIPTGIFFVLSPCYLIIDNLNQGDVGIRSFFVIWLIALHSVLLLWAIISNPAVKSRKARKKVDVRIFPIIEKKEKPRQDKKKYIKKVFLFGTGLIAIVSLVLFSRWGDFQQMSIAVTKGLLAYFGMLSFVILSIFLSKISKILRVIFLLLNALLCLFVFYGSIALLKPHQGNGFERLFEYAFPFYALGEIGGYLMSYKGGVLFVMLVSAWICWKKIIIKQLQEPIKELEEEPYEPLTVCQAREVLEMKRDHNHLNLYKTFKVMLWAGAFFFLSWACSELYLNYGIVWKYVAGFLICFGIAVFCCIQFNVELFSGIDMRYKTSQSHEVAAIGIFPLDSQIEYSRTILELFYRTILVSPFMGVGFALMSGLTGFNAFELFLFGFLLSWGGGGSFFLNEWWGIYYHGLKESGMYLIRILAAPFGLIFVFFILSPIFVPLVIFLMEADDIEELRSWDWYTLFLSLVVALAVSFVVLFRIHKQKIITLVKPLPSSRSTTDR